MLANYLRAAKPAPSPRHPGKPLQLQRRVGNCCFSTRLAFKEHAPLHPPLPTAAQGQGDPWGHRAAIPTPSSAAPRCWTGGELRQELLGGVAHQLHTGEQGAALVLLFGHGLCCVSRYPQAGDSQAPWGGEWMRGCCTGTAPRPPPALPPAPSQWGTDPHGVPPAPSSRQTHRRLEVTGGPASHPLCSQLHGPAGAEQRAFFAEDFWLLCMRTGDVPAALNPPLGAGREEERDNNSSCRRVRKRVHTQPSDWGICIAQMAAQEFQSSPRAAAAERLGGPVQLPEATALPWCLGPGGRRRTWLARRGTRAARGRPGAQQQRGAGTSPKAKGSAETSPPVHAPGTWGLHPGGVRAGGDATGLGAHVVVEAPTGQELCGRAPARAGGHDT